MYRNRRCKNQTAETCQLKQSLLLTYPENKIKSLKGFGFPLSK